MSAHSKHDIVRAKSIAWLERAVIGLNLCPFAKAVHRKSQILWQISDAQRFAEIDEALEALLQRLVETDPAHIDTAILVMPDALKDFFDFNIYLAQANARLQQMQLEGILQIASFHPRYCFEGNAADDITNATNQAPYPMLHLLREASLSTAIGNYPETQKIPERNQHTLRQLGAAGLQKLMGDWM